MDRHDELHDLTQYCCVKNKEFCREETIDAFGLMVGEQADLPNNMRNSYTKVFNMRPNNDDQEYMMNLKYTDLVIKEILNTIENDNNQDILLLLTSDHWRRSRSPSKPEPTLFIAKIILIPYLTFSLHYIFICS